MIDKFSDHLLGVVLLLSAWEHNYKLPCDIKTTLSCCGPFLLGNIAALDIGGRRNPQISGTKLAQFYKKLFDDTESEHSTHLISLLILFHLEFAFG